MRRILATAIVATAIGSTATMAPTAPVRAASVCTNPVTIGRILFMGDSITAMQGQWNRLRELLDASCASYDIANAGVPGTGTKEHWPAAAQLIAATQPDLIILNTGTNDDPGNAETNAGYLSFRDRYRKVLEAIGNAKKPSAKVFGTYPTYPRTPPAATWISMGPKTDTIYTTVYPNLGSGNWSMYVVSAMVSLNHIPGNLLDSGGVHPTGCSPWDSSGGCAAIQEDVYRTIAQVYGLPSIPDDPRQTTVQTNGG